MASAGARVVAGAPAGYAAAKAGVIALTRQLAHELGPRGLRANCLSPSAVLTERTRDHLSQERQAQMLRAFPLGRLGEPADVAAASLFLLSDASAWITGQVLDVAGGRVMPAASRPRWSAKTDARRSPASACAAICSAWTRWTCQTSRTR